MWKLWLFSKAESKVWDVLIFFLITGRQFLFHELCKHKNHKQFCQRLNKTEGYRPYYIGTLCKFGMCEQRITLNQPVARARERDEWVTATFRQSVQPPGNTVTPPFLPMDKSYNSYAHFITWMQHVISRHFADAADSLRQTSCAVLSRHLGDLGLTMEGELMKCEQITILRGSWNRFVLVSST